MSFEAWRSDLLDSVIRCRVFAWGSHGASLGRLALAPTYPVHSRHRFVRFLGCRGFVKCGPQSTSRNAVPRSVGTSLAALASQLTSRYAVPRRRRCRERSFRSSEPCCYSLCWLKSQITKSCGPGVMSKQTAKLRLSFADGQTRNLRDHSSTCSFTDINMCCLSVGICFGVCKCAVDAITKYLHNGKTLHA